MKEQILAVVKALQGGKKVEVHLNKMVGQTYYAFYVDGRAVMCYDIALTTYPHSFQEKYGMTAWNMLVGIPVSYINGKKVN